MSEYTIDIHDYERKYRNAERLVGESLLSQHNKNLILGYRDVCLRQGLCGRVRLIRVMGALTLFGRLMDKDFATITKADVEDLITRLLDAQPAYSPETIGTYKAILKRFLHWVLAPEGFPGKTPPSAVAWLTCNVRAKDKRRLQRRDLLTPEEATRLISVCDNPRDRAFVSVLWESGARIAEIGNMQLKHVTKAPHGYLLDITGKTGGRNPLVVNSAPYLSAWLAYHPFATNPDAPLWVHNRHQRAPTHVRYQAWRKLLRLLFQRAGIKKRPNPHGLRHARATHLLASGIMNEARAKLYLGWSPASTMLGTYAHLTTSDANDAILAENHLTSTTPTTPARTVRTCTICGEHNPPNAPYCIRCSNPTDDQRPYQAITTEQDTRALLIQLCDILVEKGLIAETASKLHDAGLGDSLHRLATQHRERARSPGPVPQNPVTIAQQ